MAAVEKRILIRMRRELRDLEISPPQGAICYPLNDNIVHLQAELSGPTETPYEGGTFKIEIHIPERYPFEPPRCQFLTRVYHPNIDDQGRICLNILKCPPKGTWGPAISITTMLMSLRILLANPNPDDPLLVEVANEFNENRDLFNQKAREFTKKYAMGNEESASAGQPSEDQQLDGKSTAIRLQALETLSASSSTNSSQSTRPLLPTLSSSASMSTSVAFNTGTSQGANFSTSSSISSIPLQVGGVEARSLAKPLLKKPSLRSKRTNAVADPSIANPSIANSRSSEMEVTTTERPATQSCERDAGINIDQSEDGGKALSSTKVKELVRIENNVCIASGATYPSLSDTVASTEVLISETKRKLQATRGEPLSAATKPTMSKKAKSLKTKPNESNPVERKKGVSDHLSQTAHDSSPLTLQTPLLDSQHGWVESEGHVLLASTPLTNTISKLQRSSSSEKPSKESKRHTSVKCPLGPLQPIDPPIVQSRFFSSQNTLPVEDALVVDTRLVGDCSHEKGKAKEKEKEKEKEKSKGMDMEKDKGKGKVIAAEGMRLDKGKGRAVESVHTRHEPKETDENEDAAAAVATSIFGFGEARSLKSIAVPLSMDAERTAPLTVARKRNLLKKQRPT